MKGTWIRGRRQTSESLQLLLSQWGQQADLPSGFLPFTRASPVYGAEARAQSGYYFAYDTTSALPQDN